MGDEVGNPLFVSPNLSGKQASSRLINLLSNEDKPGLEKFASTPEAKKLPARDRELLEYYKEKYKVAGNNKPKTKKRRLHKNKKHSVKRRKLRTGRKRVKHNV